LSSWNFAEVYEAVAEAIPDSPCQVQGDRVVSWADFDRRADALAADLLEAGLGQQSKVAAYLYNGPEYLETYLAAFKAGLVPLNTNYRYGPDEVAYLLDNADAEAIIFHASLSGLIEQIRPRLSSVKRWYVVNDPEGTEGAERTEGAQRASRSDGISPVPDWAVPYEEVVSRSTGRTVASWGRGPDDLLLLYTGGTTGMPKGVMWRQHDLFNVLGGGGNPILGIPPAADVEELKSRVSLGPGLRMLPVCPLMHGTGQFSSLIAMNTGGCIVTLEGHSFDPASVWRTVERDAVNALIIVGDAFARPLLAALDADPGRWDISSLRLISSSGVMWSHDVKAGLLRHQPAMVLFDSFGSSEAVGLGASTSTGGSAASTAQFQLGERVRVLTEDGRQVEPGSGETGMVAIGGWIPLGYYKDPVKSASTFRTFEGERYSVPGDFATVNADGTIHLLGRGSVCINTGGEKVYPEEVEEALKEHASVADAACVGLPDERFGEVICAVIQPAEGAVIDPDTLSEHVRARLARYKTPRRYVEVADLGRSPAGKVDYAALRRLAAEAVAAG
jgi:acyl-CoA synthetase (AMP-forming)/AMP-acid ligase II